MILLNNGAIARHSIEPQLVGRHSVPRVEYQPVRIASCQVSLCVGEIDLNRAAAVAAVTEAAARGAHIVVLPELTPSGYVFGDPAEARSLSEPADGPTAAGWGDLAARHGIVIIGGVGELCGGGPLSHNAGPRESA